MLDRARRDPAATHDAGLALELVLQMLFSEGHGPCSHLFGHRADEQAAAREWERRDIPRHQRSPGLIARVLISARALAHLDAAQSGHP